MVKGVVDFFGDPGIVLPRYLPLRAGSAFRIGIIPHFWISPPHMRYFADVELGDDGIPDEDHDSEHPPPLGEA